MFFRRSITSCYWYIFKKYSFVISRQILYNLLSCLFSWLKNQVKIVKFSFLEWQCVHSDRNLLKVVGEVAKPVSSRELRLPSDIDQYAFTKFTSVYFKAHIWGMKRDPIKSPFLAKNNETDYQSSLAIFKLVSSSLHYIL